MGDFTTLLDVASKITIIGGLLAIIWGGIKQMWVWGWLYIQTKKDFEDRLAALEKDYEDRLAALEKDRDEWKQRALDQLGINKDTLDTLKKLVAQAGKTQSVPARAPGSGAGAPAGTIEAAGFPRVIGEPQT